MELPAFLDGPVLNVRQAVDAACGISAGLNLKDLPKVGTRDTNPILEDSPAPTSANLSTWNASCESWACPLFKAVCTAAST